MGWGRSYILYRSNHKSLLNAHRGRERGRHRDRERHAVISGNFKCIMIKENKKGPKKQTNSEDHEEIGCLTHVSLKNRRHSNSGWGVGWRWRKAWNVTSLLPCVSRRGGGGERLFNLRGARGSSSTAARSRSGFSGHTPHSAPRSASFPTPTNWTRNDLVSTALGIP